MMIKRTVWILLLLALGFGSGFAEEQLVPQSPAEILAGSLPEVLAESRKLLLGSRVLDGRSCIRTVAKKGMITRLHDGDTNSCVIRLTDANGGAGLTYTDITLNREVSGPAADFKWQQETFRPWLQDRYTSNAPISKRLEELTLTARALRKEVESGAIPNVDVGSEGGSWHMRCLQNLMSAETAEQRRRWATELETAIFGLADLHRWYGLLLHNADQALAFQALTESLFLEMDPHYGGKYNPRIHIGRFPAGNLSLYGGDNFLEVERQAEGQFEPPPEWETVGGEGVQVSPPVRKLFLRILSALEGTATASVWKEAAGRPYEHSFLINQLWRAQTAEFDKELEAQVLRYARRAGDQATVEGLMDVLPYRAGALFAGLEWGDRYSESLLSTEDAPVSAEEVLKEAHDRVNGAYQKYVSLILTLRQAMESGKMDCIRATDALGAWCRNRAQPGFRVLRMSRGLRAGKTSGIGHTVAGMVIKEDDGTEKILSMDGLIKGGGRKLYPEGFDGGGTYSVDVYVRGLDGYLWVEGTIFEGPNRGQRRETELPFRLLD
jgi:hypothetical protein